MAVSLPNIPASVIALGRTALEIALVCALAVLAARSVWLVLAPDSVVPVTARATTAGPAQQVTAAAPVADRTLLTSANLFARNAETVAAPVSDDVLNAPETKLNLTLTGMRATATDGRSGSAVIVTPGGDQVLVQVGDEIIDGVLLERVFSDRVAIRSRGDLESLRMRDGEEPSVLTAARGEAEREAAPSEIGNAGPDSSAARQTASAAGSSNSGSRAAVVADQASARQLLSTVSLSPVRDGNTVRGYQLSAAGDVSQMLEYGLRPGDILLAINGRALAGQNLQQIQTLFRQTNRLELRLEREDEEVVVSVTLAEES